MGGFAGFALEFLVVFIDSSSNAPNGPDRVRSFQIFTNQFSQRRNHLAKEELLEFEGTVIDILPDARFRVKLDNAHEIIAYTAGKMKKHRIRTLIGDRVSVEMTPYDLDKGRITFRHKSESPAPSTRAQARRNVRRR